VIKFLRNCFSTISHSYHTPIALQVPVHHTVSVTAHDNHVINWPALDELKKRYIFGKRDDKLWTGTRAVICGAIRTTAFLPRRICTVARTGI